MEIGLRIEVVSERALRRGNRLLVERLSFARRGGVARKDGYAADVEVGEPDFRKTPGFNLGMRGDADDRVVAVTACELDDSRAPWRARRREQSCD